MTPGGINIHVYPAPIVRESRIFRQTAAVANSSLFDDVVVVGTRAEGLLDEEELNAGVRVSRIGELSSARPSSVIGRIRKLVAWSIQVHRRWRRQDVQAVNAHAVTVLPLCWALAKATGAVLIYDTHELETEASTARGLQQGIYQLIERVFIRRAAAVFTVNQSIARWYRAKYPGMNVKAVRNAPDSVNSGVAARTLRQRCGIPVGDRIFVHVGNIAPHRYIPEILRVFQGRAALREHVVFLGDGSLASVIRDASREYPNVHHVPSVAPLEVVSTIADADVGLCLIDPTCLSYELSLPNKALEYAAAGLPFIHTALPEVSALLGPALSHWSVHPSVGDLTTFLDELTDRAVAEGKVSLRDVVLPVWTDEAAVMIHEYRKVLGVGTT